MADNGNLSMLTRAIESVLTDEGFTIGSERAQKACLTADRLLRWIQQNEGIAVVFARKLIMKVQECCTHPNALTFHKFKERMCENNYKLCSSDEFRADWVSFIQTSIGFPGDAIFYQFVTKAIMDEVIKNQLPVVSSPVTVEASNLDFEECNALRYCAGYILLSVKKIVDKSSHPLKMALQLCVQDLFENNTVSQTALVDDDNDHQMESLQWLHSVNRGGLIIVDELLYDLFVSVESELRKHFSISNASIIDNNLKDLALKGISENEEVLFYWDIIAINWEFTEAKELLHIIIKQFVTLRGFSFAKSFMEIFKQIKRKGTQKKKGIRKRVDSTHVNHDD